MNLAITRHSLWKMTITHRHLLPPNLKFLMSLIETQNTLRKLRETRQYLHLNGVMTPEGVVRDSEW